MTRNVFIGFVASSLILSGCSSTESEPDSGPNAKTASAITDEYFEEAENLELAPEWSWPDDPGFEETADDGVGMMYEPGYGKTAAGKYWFCSWSRHFLSSTDEADRKTALTMLKSATETHMYQAGFAPELQDNTDSILEQASAGDYAELAQRTDINCPEQSA